MRKVTIKVYEFEELCEDIQETLMLTVAKEFLESIPYEQCSEGMQSAIDKAEELKTPWFTLSYIMEYAKDDIKEVCKLHEYFSDGIMYIKEGG